MVTVRVLLVLVVPSSGYLLGFHPFSQKKKFPCSPSGLLIRTTRKETPSCVTPIHLPHAGTHARRHTAPRARLLLSGRGAGARGHRSQSSGGAGRSYDPGLSGPRGQLERRGRLWTRDRGLPQTGGGGRGGGTHSISHFPRTVAASPEQQNFKYAFGV